MNTQIKTSNNKMLLLGSIAVALIIVAGRLGIHESNFTPVIAASLLAGYLFKNKSHAILTVLVAMIISDLVIGMDSIIMRSLVYGSLFLSVIAGGLIQGKDKTTLRTESRFAKSRFAKSRFLLKATAGTLFGAVAFFLITNAGVWATSGMYTLDASGLLLCFINAIPFFQNSLLATSLFATVFFGAIRLAQTLQLNPVRQKAYATIPINKK